MAQQAAKALTAAPTIQEAKALVTQAYLKSKTATSIAEYSALIESLQRATKAPSETSTWRSPRVVQVEGSCGSMAMRASEREGCFQVRE